MLAFMPLLSPVCFTIPPPYRTLRAITGFYHFLFPVIGCVAEVRISSVFDGEA